jgi:hypothetical protein
MVERLACGRVGIEPSRRVDEQHEAKMSAPR